MAAGGGDFSGRPEYIPLACNSYDRRLVLRGVNFAYITAIKYTDGQTVRRTILW